jgi:hypothetical protein
LWALFFSSFTPLPLPLLIIWSCDTLLIKTLAHPSFCLLLSVGLCPQQRKEPRFCFCLAALSRHAWQAVCTRAAACCCHGALKASFPLQQAYHFLQASLSPSQKQTQVFASAPLSMVPSLY